MGPQCGRAEKLLDLIYDAASENSLWSEVLTRIADLTGSQGGILFGQSMGAQKVYFGFNGRLSGECSRAYQESYMQNEWSMRMEHQPVGRFVYSDDAVDPATRQKTGSFDEVLRPQDVAHNAMMTLAAEENFRAAFNICRSSGVGPFGADERKIFEWLQPHLRRSALLGFRVDAYRAVQSVGLGVIDRLADGVLLFNRQAQVIYANPAMATFGGLGGVLRFSRGAALNVRSPKHDQQFSDLLRAVLSGRPAVSMSLPRSTNGGLLTLLLSSVRGLDVPRFSDRNLKDAAALLFVVDPIRRTASLSRIREAYGLTSTEARVALAAASGTTISSAALELGLSPNTVKTHLSKVFSKTGVSRQAELVRLIASIGLLDT